MTQSATPTHPAPRPHVSFGQALKNWRKYMFRFSGRASRSEFWWVMLVWFIISLVLSIIALVAVVPTFNHLQQLQEAASTSLDAYNEYRQASNELGPALAGKTLIFALIIGVFGIVQFVTMLGLWWRRLQDANFHGAFYLLSFAGPGAIVPLIMAILLSNPAGVRFDKPEDATRP
ncbi:DUF805 domain-containing protein [Rothia sp. CCM 9416]|uniref:DUF805 domain-containing protein n=1 Tax=Rothia sp. CCM 9416 TaxID=3402655 RepID=UPI003ADF2978